MVTFTAHYCAYKKGTLCGRVNMKSKDDLRKMVNAAGTDEKISRLLPGTVSIVTLLLLLFLVVQFLFIFFGSYINFIHATSSFSEISYAFS